MLAPVLTLFANMTPGFALHSSLATGTRVGFAASFALTYCGLIIGPSGMLGYSSNGNRPELAHIILSCELKWMRSGPLYQLVSANGALNHAMVTTQPVGILARCCNYHAHNVPVIKLFSRLYWDLQADMVPNFEDLDLG